MTILIFRIEFTIKLVLEEYFMAKSYLNLGFDFGSSFGYRLKTRTGVV